VHFNSSLKNVGHGINFIEALGPSQMDVFMISILDMTTSNAEKISNHEKNIKALIKRRLKEKGWNYHDLAERMEVQVLTVRRWMTSRPMKLDQFIKLMLILDIQLFSKMEEDFHAPVKTTLMTLEQEKYLSENSLAFLVFLKLLVGFKLEDVKIKYRLNQKTLLLILRQLESLNLLQLWPGEKIKVKARGPFRHMPAGPVIKTYFKIWVDLLQKHFADKFKRSHDHLEEVDMSLFRAFELYLSPQSAREFARDASHLFSKYRQLNAIEYGRRGKVVPISGIFAIDQFDSWEKIFLQLSGGKSGDSSL
jgi:transcriptional regulator with XRE-family HTH domain